MLGALLALLRGQHVDEVVWTADITYRMTGQERAGKDGPAW